MNKIIVSLFGVCILISTTLNAQNSIRPIPPLPPTPPPPPSKIATAKPTLELNYQSFKDDPLNTRIYTLANGFKVYLSVNKAEPRIQTYIAVRAGSKNDPADATGLAHYLEHMLFKGTDKFGTTNYDIEKPLLDKIYILYEDYRATTDTVKRQKIYRLIDSISGEAAKIAIANEYDKMLAAIGAKGTNAHTSFEETVYQNDIPSNQLENFLKIEGERFRNPVMRIFHTELEAVYEEKNRSLDNDNSKIWETILSGLFKKHTYGTQTTIGTVEHLKNPSLKRINEFLVRYYTAGNMALCMSGDFDPEVAFKMIEESFGKLPKNNIAEKIPMVIEEPITTPVIKDVYGPNAESVNIGYRFAGNGTLDADMIALVSKLLYNETAGLLDLDLNQAQKVLGASAEAYSLNDYSMFFLSAEAKEGQKLEEAKDLLLTEIEKLKKGEFPEWLIKAAINDMKLKQTKDFENNASRATFLYNSFISNVSYPYELTKFQRLANFSKQQIIDFVIKNFKNNYVVVYKRIGQDKNVTKITKPKITPVETNANLQSPFLKEVLNFPLQETLPVFIDYKSAIRNFTINSNIPLWYVKNNINNLFSLTYVFDFGTGSNKKIGLALDYFTMLGTSKMTAAEVSQAFYKLGCSYETKVEEDVTKITLSGLSENFDEAVKLLELFLTDCQSSTDAFKNVLGALSKSRTDAKLNKNIILQQALLNYGYFGKKSPFTNVLNTDEIEDLKENELTDIIRTLCSYKHSLWYYGTIESDMIEAKMNGLHQTQKTLRELPTAVKLEQLPTTENKVFACDYNMKQAEIIMLSKQSIFDKAELPQIKLFQEYFGGGMQSIVFQTMRESKALAYSVYSRYVVPTIKERSYYTLSYIGTQADKLPEAMVGMHQLFDSLPQIPSNFDGAKKSLLQKIRSERIQPSEYFITYYNALKLGIDYDIRKDVFEQLPKLTLADITQFHKIHFKNKTYTTLLIGKKESIKAEALVNYGKLEWLNLNEVFGY
jgi:predicted Zn-dependent peptidase